MMVEAPSKHSLELLLLKLTLQAGIICIFAALILMPHKCVKINKVE